MRKVIQAQPASEEGARVQFKNHMSWWSPTHILLATAQKEHKKSWKAKMRRTCLLVTLSTLLRLMGDALQNHINYFFLFFFLFFLFVLFCFVLIVFIIILFGNYLELRTSLVSRPVKIATAYTHLVLRNIAPWNNINHFVIFSNTKSITE